MKKLFLTIPAVLLGTSLSMTAMAAPEIRDGVVFDPAFYAAAYPDVVAVYGTDPDKLYEHYVTYGKAENRLTFDTSQLPEAQATAPVQEEPRYKFSFLQGAPQTDAAWMAELIDYARIYNKGDKYIHGYPYAWDQGLADAAQLRARNDVYLKTKEQEVNPEAWRAAVPERFRANLQEIIFEGNGSPEEIIGYWTQWQDERTHYTADGTFVKEPGRFIHPGSILNKLFNHNARYIGVGHVIDDKYVNRHYWVVFISE